MNKFSICTVLICLVLASADAHGPRNPGSGGDRRPPQRRDPNQWIKDLCSNSTTAQAFLTQTRQVITTLIQNGSYTQVLQKRSQQVAYIQSETNAQLLSSNCTQYFAGLLAARNLDGQANLQQENLERNADKLFQQLIQNIVGYSADSHERH